MMIINCLYDELVEVNKLKPYPKNPNIHPVDQIKQLAYNINYLGWRKPVVVSKLSGHVITGHGAIEAAKLNKWEKVPVNYQEFKDEAEEFAYVVSDNSLQEYSALDISLIETEKLNFQDLDYNLLAIEDLDIAPPDTKEVSFKAKTGNEKDKTITCPNCGHSWKKEKKKKEKKEDAN